MTTKKLYIDNTYQFSFNAVIQSVGEDERGVFIVLDQTAFYPQGGGQPSDQGIIKNDDFEISIIYVAQKDGEIRHYIDSVAIQELVSQNIQGVLNQERRLINARHHTASHLLSNIVEILDPNLKTIKGHSFPGESYVEFQGASLVDASMVQDEINAATARHDRVISFEADLLAFENQFYRLSYSIANQKKFRIVQIADMPPVPCGGTHVGFTDEIGSIRISKIKSKNKSLRVSYEVI